MWKLSEDMLPNQLMKIRAPWDCLGDCIWLARLTDKARLMHQSKLPPDYLMLLGHPLGIDGHFLRHFGLDKDSTLEAIAAQSDDKSVEHWFLAQSGVTEATIKSWNELAPNLGRLGWPGERELAIAIERFYSGSVGDLPVETLFELIRIDEKIPSSPSKTQSFVTTHPS